MSKGATIFIPVYNEAQRIEKAIRSAAPQCEHLMVSDNASSDGTDAICLRLQAEYPNMEFFRQEVNIGALNNWLFLLNRVETPFVMALGSHDSIDSNYVDHLQAVLENDSNTELAVGELFFELNAEVNRDEAFSDWKGGEQDIAVARVHACVFDKVNLGWTAYGLFRTDTLKRILLGDNNPTYGIDMILLAKIAAQGKIRVVQNTRYHAWVRDTDNKGSYVERLLGQNKARSVTFKMRNSFRCALFEIYVSANNFDSHWKLLWARYRFMARIGVFKNQGPDYDYYFLYLPVKITRRLVRGF